MERLVQLRQQRAGLIEQARGLLNKAKAENRALIPDEKTQYDALMAQVRSLADEIQREEELAALEADLRTIVPPAAPPDPADPPARGGASETRSDIDRWLSPEQRAAFDVRVGRNRAADRPWDERGRMAVAFGNMLIAVRQAVITNGRSMDPRLFEQRAPSGAASNVPEDGGFFVQQEMQDVILQRMYDVGQLLSRVRRIPLTNPNSNGIKINAIKESSRATGSRWGGVQGYWVAQGNAPTASKPAYRQISLTLEKLAALGYATDELLQDAGALGNIMMEGFTEELTFLTEDSIINGTGAGQPVGVLTSNALIQVAKETGQAAKTVVFENIVNMWSRMWARSRQNAVWIYNQDCEPQFFALSKTVGTGGLPVWLPANGLAGQQFSTLMGRPLIPIEYAATLGTVGDIMLVDLSQYLMIDKGSPQAATSMHVLFTTDEMAFRLIYRVDGEPTWESALTPFKGSNTVSPFVSLATRA